MKCNFIHIKFKDKKYTNLNNNKILKLSLGNKINNKLIQKNIAKMKYKKTENMNEKNILNKIFISNNIKRAKVIINNKQYDLKEKIDNKLNKDDKIKIKFLDNIININSMFKDCESLSSVYNLQYLNTKYLKSIKNLFDGCSSLLNIDDISNWNINNVNDISYIF